MEFLSFEQKFAESIRRNGPDANGQKAERVISDGSAKPCRSCLRNIERGREMLVLAACPFPEPQPYAETGPIFFCADSCTPWKDTGLPPILTTSPDYLLKAYGADDRIIYGTGQITPQNQIESYVNTLFERADVAYIDVRSARNNCFLTRTKCDDRPQ